MAEEHMTPAIELLAQRYERLLSIIRRRLAECTQARDKYNELELIGSIPRATLDRKRYAIDSIEMALQAILSEIGEPEIEPVTEESRGVV